MPILFPRSSAIGDPWFDFPIRTVRPHRITGVSKQKITGAERRKINAAPCLRYKFCFVCSRSSFLLLPTNITAENEGTNHSVPAVIWYCCYIDNSQRGTAEPSSVHGGSGDCERTYIFQCLRRNITHLSSPDSTCFPITSIVPFCFVLIGCFYCGVCRMRRASLFAPASLFLLPFSFLPHPQTRGLPKKDHKSRLTISTCYKGCSQVAKDCTPPEMLCTSAATLNRLPRFFLELADGSLRLACLLALCRLYCTTSG
jgi:hypothetical protein